MAHSMNRKSAWLLACIVTVSVAAAAQTPVQTPAKSPPQAAPAPQTSAPATAPPTMAPGMAAPAPLSASDKKFMHNAALGGIAEVQMSELAVQKASNAQVKQFAEKMVTDHSKANDKLKQIATSKNVILPTAMSTAAKRETDKLSKMSGAAFDREYMKHQLADHKKVVAEFRAATKQARDPDLKQFAQDTLPTIEQHLEMAKNTTSKRS